MTNPDPEKIVSKKTGIYIIPGMFTAMNMALGFYSVTASINEQWSDAAWCIIAAIVLDMLDGRIARMTNSCSKFGIEFDSLADLVSFGVAPAVMMYMIALKDYEHGRVGFAISLLFVICGSLRLARFNVKANAAEDETPTSYFTGLPIPAAGGVLASFVILYDIWSAGKKARTIKIVMQQIPAFYHLLPGIVFLLSILMVSNLRYVSFKKMNVVKARSVNTFLITVLVCLMIYMYPQNTIFIIFVGYICSGIMEYFWRIYRLRHAKKDFQIETPDGQSWEVKRKKVI